MELSNSITEYGQARCSGIRCGNVVLGSVYAGGRAWRLNMSVCGTAMFEKVLEFCTLVHNFASHFDAGSASRASALNAHPS